MPCKLSVNVNAIAYLRNRRDLPWPSVEGLSRVALEAGAIGITVHPRPDERHIRRTDVTTIREMLRKDYPGKEFNIEGYPDARFLALVEAEQPDQVTLVPDDPGQGTSDHGWDIAANRALLTQTIARLHKAKMRVSVFVDPDPRPLRWPRRSAPTGSKSTPAPMAAPSSGKRCGASSRKSWRPARRLLRRAWPQCGA